MTNRVAVSGMGVVCSIGKNLEEFEQSLRQGVCGLKPIHPDRFDTSDPYFRIQRGCTVDQELYQEVADRDDTILTEFSIRAAREAMRRANIDLDKVDPRRVGLCLGTSVGGCYPFMEWIQRELSGKERDYSLLRYNTPTITGKVARALGVRGPLSTISTACAAGTNSIGRAYDLLQNGKVDYVIAGGVDIFTYLTFSGFNSLFALSKGACQPFAGKRDGLNLGDAAAFVVLERPETARKRGIIPAVEVGGYATVNEAYHATAPHPEGIYARQAMEIALEKSGATAAELDFINAHGTATKANDKMESRAISDLVQDREVVVASTKALTGHSLGAAGSLEFVATALSVAKNFVPVTNQVEDPILPEGNIRLATAAVKDRPIDLAISNSFGFSGNMASVVLRKHYPAA